MKKMKRVLAIVLTVVTTVSLIPVMDQEAVQASEAGFDIGLVNFDATLSGDDMEKENLAKMKDYIKDAYADGDEILLFPEYSLTSTTEDAIDVDSDKSVTAISTLAETYEMYILFGSMIEEDENYYSAIVICSPDGTVDTYKKTHLNDEEYEMGLSVGDDPYVISTEYGNFGLALGQEFAEVAELGKYYYGSSVRMVLVAQSYGYKMGDNNALSQNEYDMYTATYAYVRMYSRYVAVANLYTAEGDIAYFGESHACTAYADASGWIAGCNGGTKPATTTEAGVVSGTVGQSSRDSSNGMSSRRLNQLADWYGELTDYELPVYGEGSEYKDDVTVASVNFHPVWGEVNANVETIEEIMAEAHEDGVELLVFPEMALTGYDVVLPDSYDSELEALYGDDYMQHVCAQVVRGDNPSDVIVELQELAESYGMYVLIGLPEQDEEDPDVYWNSVAILGPDLIQSYRKVNLASPEPNWASYGTENDGIIETPFGYVGVAICADIYNCQELQRTYSEMGCRIVINCTAGAASNNCSDGSWQLTYQNRLESFMLRDDSFMITSNLVGYEGPTTTAVTDLLDSYGYKVDDIDTTWLADNTLSAIFDEVTALYATSSSSARTYIFPGASVCIGLDETTSTGTYVFGNYTSSGVTSDGTANPYMNLTTDTFNQYYVGEFDLSKATLYNFYSKNPYDYRPDLYYEWYCDMFYNTYGYSVDEMSYEDVNTGVVISGDEVMSESTFSVTKSDVDTADYLASGYTVDTATSYDISSNAALTTEYTKTTVYDTSGKQTGTVTENYTGSYLAYFGDILVTIPVDSDADMVKVYTSEGSSDVEVVEGTVSVKLNADDIITVVKYKAIEEEQKTGDGTVTGTESTTSGTTVSDPTSENTTLASASVGKAKIKTAKKTGTKKAKLKLKKVKSATGYVVKYSTSKKFKAKKTKTKKTTKTTVVLKKLKAKKTYYVRVRAYKSVDGTMYYGAWSKTKKIKKK